MNRKIKCSDFIQPEYDKIIELARFTEEQRKVFDLLNEDRKNDEGIMFTLHLSRKRYYAIKKAVINKIVRIAFAHRWAPVLFYKRNCL